MNYSQTGIANLALGRIGARGLITDVNENTPNAKKVLAVWDFIFQEVLSERDWKFAKTRTTLQLSTSTPLYNWQFAWVMPSDYLRFVRPIRQNQYRNRNISNTFNGSIAFFPFGPIPGWYYIDDWPFFPTVDYKVEAVQTGTTTDGSGNTIPLYTQCAVTNYDGTFFGPVMITYIRLITDLTQLMPGFVNCFANRLAAELAIPITEDKQKFEGMMQVYRDSLNSAEAQNECQDFQADEWGSNAWVNAGRYVRWGW